jgi:hypothetical protein
MITEQMQKDEVNEDQIVKCKKDLKIMFTCYIVAVYGNIQEKIFNEEFCDDVSSNEGKIITMKKI